MKLLPVGTRVKLNKQASRLHNTEGEIIGHDPTHFWHYRIRHLTGEGHPDHLKEFWWLKNQVKEVTNA